MLTKKQPILRGSQYKWWGMAKIYNSTPDLRYSEDRYSTRWRGYSLASAESFSTYMSSRVRAEAFELEYLVGMSLGDTEVIEQDLNAAALHLAETFRFPTKVELDAWYFPVLIKDWPSLIIGDRR